MPNEDVTRATASTTTNADKLELPPEEEPITTGTVFLTSILLMMIFGFWIVMYMMLLNR
ncbi:MAG TPA: hypothetical protein VFT99_04825 [Roseiflexaceae bacterium]|nr:hypothetical protein [Roseiflexaceae bacterium]